MEKNEYLDMVHQLQFVKGEPPTKVLQPGDLVLVKGIVFILLLFYSHYQYCPHFILVFF